MTECLMPYAVMPICIKLCDALLCKEVHAEGNVHKHEEEQNCCVESYNS